MVSLIVFLKAKGYPFKVFLKRTRGLVLNEKFLFGISAFDVSIFSSQNLCSQLDGPGAYVHITQ